MQDIIIIDPSSNQLADLITLNCEISRGLNDEFILSFTCFEHELKTLYLTTSNSAYIDSQTFDMMYIEKDHSQNEISYRVEARHVFYRLMQEKLYSYITFSGTPTAILTSLLTSTDFTVGTIEFSTPTTFTIDSDTNIAAAIITFANTLGAKIDFGSSGFEISLMDYSTDDNNYEIRIGKNLKGIKKILDKRSGTEIISYQVDVLELKNSDEYINKALQALEIINLGDTCYVVDEDADIDISTKIIKIAYDPRYRKNTQIELSNKIENITDKLISVEQNANKKNEYVNGVNISPQNGFVAIGLNPLDLTESFSKIAIDIEGLAIYTGVGDYHGVGLTDKVFYVDTDGRIQATSIDISGDGTFAGALSAASGSFTGDLSAVGGTFTGTLSGVDGTFSGTITASAISGGTIDGTEIIASKFRGSVAGSAYAEIGAGAGNLGDFTLKRGGVGGNFFRILDDIPAISLQTTDNTNAFHTFLSSYNDNTYTYGYWEYGGYEIANQDYVDGVMAAHISAYH